MKCPKLYYVFIVFILLVVMACGTAAPTVIPDGQANQQVQANAERDDVFVIEGNQANPQPLPAGEVALLNVGQGVDVDETGQAILLFSDLLTVEVLRDGELTIQQVALEEQSLFVNVLQVGGAVVHNFNPAAEIDRRFTVETEFAIIEATGTEFLVVKEINTPLEWIVGFDAPLGDLTITDKQSGISKPVVSNQARWVAPIGEPSPGIDADMGRVKNWLQNVQAGSTQPPVGTVIWNQADIIINTSNLTTIPPVNTPFDLQGGLDNAIKLSLAGQVVMDTPSYSLKDCNRDGWLDIVFENGQLDFDFRNVLARVNAIDVTVINLDAPNKGLMTVLNPAKTIILEQPLVSQANESQIFTFRSDQPFHYATLSMEKGCFLGLSLTPPQQPPRPAVDIENTKPNLPTATPTVDPNTPFVVIGYPPDKSTDVINGFTLSGSATVPFERELLLVIETEAGEEIQLAPIQIEGGELGGEPGVFYEEIRVDYPLPANIRLRVQHLSARDGSVWAEDTILLTPLLAREGNFPTETPTPTTTPIANRPPENGQFTAFAVANTPLKIDGDSTDWDVLFRVNNTDWQTFQNITSEYEQTTTCDNRYPYFTIDPTIDTSDLVGRVAFAYNRQYLYVAFFVDDDGYVPYTGSDYRYFLGDSPQLLLDVNLEDDYLDTTLNADDWQIDFFLGDAGPRGTGLAALWQLSALTVQPLQSALIASAPINDYSYFMEAAIPWASFNINPQADLSLGIVASISDNDTPDTNIQECMISTALQRNWQNPTTWGTLTLQ